MPTKNIYWFEELDKHDIDKAGGKGANLGELTQAGIPVPPGFVVTASAYFDFLKYNRIDLKIKKLLSGLDPEKTKDLNCAAKEVQELIQKSKLSNQLAEQIRLGKRPRIFHDGEQTRDHIYVKDAVDANLKASESKQSGIFNVATGKATSFNRVIQILNQVLGTNLAPDYFNNPYGFYKNCTKADITAAEQVLGFKARWSIEEGVREYLTAFYGLKSEKSVSIQI